MASHEDITGETHTDQTHEASARAAERTRELINITDLLDCVERRVQGAKDGLEIQMSHQRNSAAQEGAVECATHGLAAAMEAVDHVEAQANDFLAAIAALPPAEQAVAEDDAKEAAHILARITNLRSQDVRHAPTTTGL